MTVLTIDHLRVSSRRQRTIFSLGTLTKPRSYRFVILSRAKNLSLYATIETLRFAQGDMEGVLLERLSQYSLDNSQFIRE